MNAERLKENLYSVVLLDGNEKADVNLDTIKEWYFKRQINESSLIFAPEIGQWQMLKKVINVDEFKAEIANKNRANFQTAESTFNAPAPAFAAPSPVNFSAASSAGNANYQNYSTETYRNSPPRLAYSAANNFNSAFAAARGGLRLAAIFFVTNSILWFISLFVLVLSYSDLNSEANSASKFGEMVGRGLIRLFLDLYLANRLWNAAGNDNKGRVFSIFRVYAGLVFLLPFVFPYFWAGFYAAGFTALGAIVFTHSVFCSSCTARDRLRPQEWRLVGYV